MQNSNPAPGLLWRLLFFTALALLLMACGSSEKRRNSVKLSQYMVAGMTLYQQHCANCHQVDGKGLAKLVPPLHQSDYLKSLKSNDMACQIRYGLSDTIYVNGEMYHQPMPSNPRLTPLEIAEIVTYVKNKWGSEPGLYEVKKAEKALQNCQ